MNEANEEDYIGDSEEEHDVEEEKMNSAMRAQIMHSRPGHSQPTHQQRQNLEEFLRSRP